MIIHGDCLDVMAGMDAGSVDTVITDPPYALVGASRGGSSQPGDMTTPYGRSGPSKKRGGFMGKEWDAAIPGVEYWAAALRVAKPGAMLLAFGGTRTHHRLMCAIEDAGWEIRDCLMWLYGSGFPKSHDISKGIDKAAGAVREVVGPRVTGDGHIQNRQHGTNEFGTFKIAQDGVDMDTAPSTDAAKTWDGYGTALKPAWEPIILAMKPLDGTFATNALKHGVAGLNIDGGRIQYGKEDMEQRKARTGSKTGIKYGTAGCNVPYSNGVVAEVNTAGRWPANLLLDEDAAAMLDAQAGDCPSGSRAAGVRAGMGYHSSARGDGGPAIEASVGGPSRFFYCAKASTSERNDGLDNTGRNIHSTVKPLDLMVYLCKLTRTPTGGTVLDPFAGSGSTGVACVKTERPFVGIEIDAEYCAIAEARIRTAVAQGVQQEIPHG